MMLEVRDLHTQFSTEEGTVHAVAGVSLSVEPGEVLGVVGESGSGKSVTAMSILRLIPDPPGRITAGEILWKDGEGPAKDLARADDKAMQRIRGDRIAMIFQDPMMTLNPVLRIQDPMTSLTPYMTIGDQLSEVLEVHRGQRRKEARAASARMLGAVGIPRPEDRMDDYPHQLSGGMRQRVMIAMALLCEPSLLIADEPTTALDVTVQAEVLDVVRDLQRELHQGIVVVTHNFGVVADICDRVVVMQNGELVDQGDTRSILRSPRHAYTRMLLASMLEGKEPKTRLLGDEEMAVMS